MIQKIAVFLLCVAFLFYRVQVYFTARQEKAELHLFLKENSLLDYETRLHKFGKFIGLCSSYGCCNLSIFFFVSVIAI